MNKESHTNIQTLRKKCLAECCRGRLHRSAQGRACLDIEAFQEPRCRPAPLCRASGRTCSDSTLRNSTALILYEQRYTLKTTHPVILYDSLLHSVRPTTIPKAYHPVILYDQQSHPELDSESLPNHPVIRSPFCSYVCNWRTE